MHRLEMFKFKVFNNNICPWPVQWSNKPWYSKFVSPQRVPLCLFPVYFQYTGNHFLTYTARYALALPFDLSLLLLSIVSVRGIHVLCLSKWVPKLSLSVLLIRMCFVSRFRLLQFVDVIDYWFKVIDANVYICVYMYVQHQLYSNNT
jgi:hypothetical protein